MAVKKYEIINNNVCRQIRQEIDTLLEDYGKKKGLLIKLGRRLRYSDISINGKIEIQLLGSGSLEDLKRKQFAQDAPRCGLKPEHLGREFTLNTKDFTLVGITPRRRKYPLQIEDENGKMYSCTVSSFLNAIGEELVAARVTISRKRKRRKRR